MNVRHSDAPRSLAASSSSRLNEASRARTITATNGKLNEMCAMMIAPRLSGHGRSSGHGMIAREEHQHGDAHADFRHHDRQRQRALERRLERKAETPAGDRDQRAEDHADRGWRSPRSSANCRTRSSRSLSLNTAPYQSSVKPCPDDVAAALVEAERHQRQQRRVEEDRDQHEPQAQRPAGEIIERGGVLFHRLQPLPPSGRSSPAPRSRRRSGTSG